MSLRNYQDLLELIDIDKDLYLLINKLKLSFEKYPYLTFTYLSREMKLNVVEISDLIKPLVVNNLIEFKYQLECPECFNDIITNDSYDELLKEEIECRFESCRHVFHPEEDDILVKICKTKYWDSFCEQFFRKHETRVTILHCQ